MTSGESSIGSRAELYRLHSSVGRRRRKALGRAAAALALLLVVVLGFAAPGDPGTLLAGTSAGSGGQDSGPLGRQDGFVPPDASLSPFSDERAVTKLDPNLREALLEAARDAAAGGITLRVNSGWRSARYQRALFRQAVQAYGSIEGARKYVLPPSESDHVTGEAVDIGPPESAAGSPSSAANMDSVRSTTTSRGTSS